MISLINSIIDRDFIAADSILEESVEVIMSRKLEEAKKMYAAKMTEQQGHVMNRTASQLNRLGVVEEDNIEEMDLSREKPDYANIEDRRGTRNPSWFMKNVNVVNTGPKTKAIVAKEPNTTVVQKTAMKEEKESGEESSMARSELNAITKDAKSIMSKVKGNKELEAWTQSKITKAADYLNSVADYMDDEEKLDEARINIIKARIRGGKIQRRKRVSNVPGMTLRGGKLQRMSAAERRRRKLGARKAVRKRMPKMNRALMKRKRSLMKRRALGI